MDTLVIGHTEHDDDVVTTSRRPARARLLKVHTTLPAWVMDSLPRRRRFVILRAAAIVGMRTRNAQDVVRLAQLGVYRTSTAMPSSVPIRLTSKQYRELHMFGNRVCATEVGDILRTAIMLGLDMPEGRLGIVVPVERPKIRPMRWYVDLVERAGLPGSALSQPYKGGKRVVAHPWDAEFDKYPPLIPQEPIEI